jgi:hypothetical protein
MQRQWVSHDVLGMFSPITLLPSQLRDRTGDCPERRLVAAVMEDAIALIRRQAKGPDAAREAALEWVRADDREWPFSFVNLCDVLRLDVDAVREALLRDPDAMRPIPRTWMREIVGYRPSVRVPRTLKDADRRAKRQRDRERYALVRVARRKARCSEPSSTPSTSSTA